MNVQRKQSSILKRTVQSGLPTWTGASEGMLIVPGNEDAFERFFHNAFGDTDRPTMIYGDQGQRLITPITQDGPQAFPKEICALKDSADDAHFIFQDSSLFFVSGRMERWPLAPQEVAFVVSRIDRDWFNSITDISATSSEFTLIGHLLSGRDLAGAATEVGATYDTKRKQVRQILEKACVKNQAALLRDLSLTLSSHVLSDQLRPDQRRPEVELAQNVFGRDATLHSITLGSSQDIPLWEFGARRGQPVLYFHSMLAPILFNPDTAKHLKAHNIRLLMIPRHFFEAPQGAGTHQRQILQAAADVVEYLCDEPVICLGESAGCAWAAQFSRFYPDLVSEVVLAATPQAIRPEDAARILPRSASLLNEVSTYLRRDARVIAGLTRIYNSIARVPSLARRSLDFMLRGAPSDQSTITRAFETMALDQWVRLIANKAHRSSIEEVAHLQSDWVKNLHTIEHPKRFFHGVEDPLCPVDDAEAMARGLPNATFTTFENAGHLVLGQNLNDILNALFLPQKSNENDTLQSV